jgi:hypothetical protein
MKYLKCKAGLNKFILFFLIFLTATILWLAGVFWSASWIDGKTQDVFPKGHELSIARWFWSLTPAINRGPDADRALKLSWLAIMAEINQKTKTEINVANTLDSESQFISSYLRSNWKSISVDLQSRAIVQLLTYLNRIELYRKLSRPDFDEQLQNIGDKISSAPPSVQEDWYREMMIRAYMKGDSYAFQEDRKKLVKILEAYAQEIPQDLRDGSINYYEGVLACISKNPQNAIAPLSKAIKLMATNQQMALNFFRGDFNIILIGKGMDGGDKCKELLEKLISGMGE